MRARDVPEDHEGCGREPCVACRAREHLLPGDWSVVSFYQFVSDQVTNPAPLGLEGGKTWLPLSLPALVSACDLLEIPQEQRVSLVSDARWLHDVVTEREKIKGLHKMPESALAPPEA